MGKSAGQVEPIDSLSGQRGSQGALLRTQCAKLFAALRITRQRGALQLDDATRDPVGILCSVIPAEAIDSPNCVNVRVSVIVARPNGDGCILPSQYCSLVVVAVGHKGL
jgi:hypothetical protein